ncbi:hypothetical protein [Streptomyces sp. NPDC048521]
MTDTDLSADLRMDVALHAAARIPLSLALTSPVMPDVLNHVGALEESRSS